MGDLSGRTIWQLAAGDRGRSYHQDVIDWHVALVGPSDDGDYNANPECYEGDSAVRQFATVDDGGIVVLKEGRSQAHAIGVLGPYEWDERFSNVRGWSQSHSRPVRWINKVPRSFPNNTFAIPRFCRCDNEAVHDWIRNSIKRGSDADLAPPARDHIEVPYQMEPWPDPPMAVAEIVARVRTFWEYIHGGEHLNFGGHASEAEVRSHLVVPFLLALGWPREQIAIEWKHMDVALYADVPRTEKNCKVIVETKTMFTGLDGAFEQAKRYRKHGPDADILVTDGSQIEWRARWDTKEEKDVLRGSLKQPNRATEKIVSELRYTG